MGTGPTFQRLGRYHLAAPLGGGPTGEVFRAHVYGVAGGEREFAVKRFHPALISTPEKANALGIAARLYGGLSHPRIAKLHEFGVEEDGTFAAVEYVEGLDLSRVLQPGTLPKGAAAAAIVQIGRAVGYAHGRGLSHLGLCPRNVIVTPSGDVKVTDFGYLPLRLPTDPASDATLLDRLYHLSPEQLEGQRTSPATDVYQLGLLAYELLVGSRPFRGGSAAALKAQVSASQYPSTGLPGPIDKVLRRALARSPFQRFPDTGAMVDALEAALRSDPLSGGSPDLAERVQANARERAQGEEPSGAVSFPIPAPPKVEVPIAPPSPLSATPTAPKLGPTSTMLGLTPAPKQATGKRGDSEGEGLSLGSIPIDGRQQTYSEVDPETIPRHRTAPDESGADFLLGPAGTTTAPGQLVGGEDVRLSADSLEDEETRVKPRTPSPHDEEPTKVRPEQREQVDEEGRTAIRGQTNPVDDGDVLSGLELVEDSVQIPLGANPSGNVGPMGTRRMATPPPPIPTSPATPASTPPLREGEFANLGEVLDLDPDDEASALLPIPEDLSMAKEVPQLATAGSRPAHSEPTEEPLPTAVLPKRAKVAAPRTSKMGPQFAVLLLLLAAAGFVGVKLWMEQSQKSSPSVVQNDRDADVGQGVVIPVDDPPTTDAPSAEVPPPTKTDAGVTPPTDAASGLAVPGDTADAGSAQVDEPPAEGVLSIRSEPDGAKVYLDGTLVGKTPLELDSSSDKHRLAVILEGYDLHLDEIAGGGEVNVTLAEVTPPDGPAGIKVRCRQKNRYYVFVDDQPVGQLCPSERIGVDRGVHEVEIYDPVTDSRRVFSVTVKETRLSLRVRVD